MIASTNELCSAARRCTACGLLFTKEMDPPTGYRQTVVRTAMPMTMVSDRAGELAAADQLLCRRLFTAATLRQQAPWGP
jgi:hypothetical protein